MRTIGGKSGFTLAEMLVVLGLLAVILAITLPIAPRSMAERQLDEAAERLASTLRDARSRAMLRSTREMVTVDARHRRFVDETTGSVNDIAQDITFTATGIDRRQGEDVVTYVFFPDGGSTGGFILLRRSGYEREVAISWLTGHVTAGHPP